MEKITTKQALTVILASVLRAIYRVVSKTLYTLFRFEFKQEREYRIRKMQRLLDKDHMERLGWTGAVRMEVANN